MDLQILAIIALCVAAAAYLGRRVWQQFSAKNEAGCAKGCGGACGATLDVDRLQRTIETRQAGR